MFHDQIDEILPSLSVYQSTGFPTGSLHRLLFIEAEIGSIFLIPQQLELLGVRCRSGGSVKGLDRLDVYFYSSAQSFIG
jgi:hypothetical protein